MMTNTERFRIGVEGFKNSCVPEIIIDVYEDSPDVVVNLSSDNRYLIEQLQRLIDVAAHQNRLTRGYSGVIEGNPDRA